MKTYKSKIGPELSIPMFGLLIVVGACMVFKGSWVGLGVVLLIFLLVLHLFLTTYYQITGHDVRIKSGFFFDEIVHISAIKKVIETRNPISSPALSLDRIELKYNRFDSIIISPSEKMMFINDLLQVRPEIEIHLTKEL